MLAVPTDVSSRQAVEELAERVYRHFGAAHLLANNAGVSGGGAGALWQSSEADWQWVLGVNLMGVVHGIQAFVPRMLEGGDEGHIVNTSSVLGLSTGTGSIYGVSKHAVTRLTEGLHYDLQAAGAKLRASVLCPGMIATRILWSERNRPERLRNRTAAADSEIAARREAIQKHFEEHGMPPVRVGEIVLEAIREDRGPSPLPPPAFGPFTPPRAPQEKP